MFDCPASRKTRSFGLRVGGPERPEREEERGADEQHECEGLRGHGASIVSLPRALGLRSGPRLMPTTPAESVVEWPGPPRWRHRRARNGPALDTARRILTTHRVRGPGARPACDHSSRRGAMHPRRPPRASHRAPALPCCGAGSRLRAARPPPPRVHVGATRNSLTGHAPLAVWTPGTGGWSSWASCASAWNGGFTDWPPSLYGTYTFGP